MEKEIELRIMEARKFYSKTVQESIQRLADCQSKTKEGLKRYRAEKKLLKQERLALDAVTVANSVGFLISQKIKCELKMDRIEKEFESVMNFQYPNLSRSSKEYNKKWTSHKSRSGYKVTQQQLKTINKIINAIDGGLALNQDVVVAA